MIVDGGKEEEEDQVVGAQWGQLEQGAQKGCAEAQAMSWFFLAY